MEPSAKLHSDFSYVDQRSQSRSYVQKFKYQPIGLVKRNKYEKYDSTIL